jgi:3-methyladenine DNA glycosylase AlkD
VNKCRFDLCEIDPWKIRAELEGMAEEKYRNFAQALIPDSAQMLGVRLPGLRKLAAKIAVFNPLSYLKSDDEKYFEETMLKGFVIGLLKIDQEEQLELVAHHVKRITDWSLCDSFCCSLKFASKSQGRVWEFLMPFLQSEHPFSVRFAVVMLMDYFIDAEHLDSVLSILDDLPSDNYYVSMATAWALSTCFVRFPDKTMRFLEVSHLDDDTYGRTLQKIVDSRRVEECAKFQIRSMRRYG